MDPQPADPAASPPLKLSRRKLTIAAVAAAALLVIVIVLVLVLRGGGAPNQDEVARELRTAIDELSPKKSGSDTARFDTAALRARLDGLDGWFISLAADNQASRVGVAARQIEGSTCVFAWSDVGIARSAVVSDPNLPCVAEISLIPAKSPA